MNRQTFLIAAFGAILLAAPALVAPATAQFGSIFGEPPPRPPGAVPGGGGGPVNDDRYQPRIYQPEGVPQPPPQQGWPQQDPRFPQQAGRPPAQQPGYPPPPGAYPGQPGAYPGQPPAPPPPATGVQSQPLPPPPGSTAAAPPAGAVGPQGQQPQGRPGAPGQPPVANLPPGQRPPGTPQPANTGPQPGDEVITPSPATKIENPTAIFSGLDKITGRITTFDVAIDETVQFGALQVTPRACYTRAATETPNTDAFLEVDEITLQGEVKRIYTGWMFAASPGLHAVEHPIYDVWLKDCKGGAPPTVTAEGAPAAAPTPPAPRPQQPKQQQRPRQTLPPPPPSVPPQQNPFFR